MIQNVPGTLNGNVQNTGLGIFLENGTGILSNYMSAIIRNVSKTKGGGIYYLSGVYYTPEASKLAMADYDGLFALLTKNFQYIIIDFGRLGCSEVNDQVIKVISDIAFKNIIVSTTNPFEVRNLKKKIDNIHLDTSRAAWLFNLCSTTALDQNVRNMISPITFDLIPRMEGFEQGCTFLRVNSIRDRFGTFVDNKVFGKR
jgi:MinD-like ATPase involved in chromosome partitioning or flagellar assembly